MDRTLTKGLWLIELLAAANGSLGVSDLAKTAGLTKSNTHRLLQTLIKAGWVTRSRDSSNYELSLNIWSIANSVIDHLGIRQIARPRLRALNLESQETVHLAVLEQSSVVFIDRLETSSAVRAVLSLDARAPAYCVATGKALLAFQDPAIIEEVCCNLEPHTLATITDPKRLKSELQKVKSSGYAISEGEWQTWRIRNRSSDFRCSGRGRRLHWPCRPGGAFLGCIDSTPLADGPPCSRANIR